MERKDRPARRCDARILQQFVRSKLDITLIEIDLSAEKRLTSNGAVVSDAIAALKQYGEGVKNAGMTVNRQQLDELLAKHPEIVEGELRAERNDRSSSIVDADPDRYARFAAAAGEAEAPALGRAVAERQWTRLRRRGKRASMLRLLKASFTFAGGIDYLAWKINRHAGTDIRVAPWQRRWPRLAALILLPRLLARGAVR